MLVHGLGETKDGRLGRQCHDVPERGEGESGPALAGPPGERAQGDEHRQAHAGLRLRERVDERIVEPVDDQRIGPEEQAQVVEVRRPLGHEVRQGRDAGLVRHLDDVRRQEERPVEDAGDGQRRERREQAPGGCRPAAPAGEEPVPEQGDGERHGDRLGEERQGEEEQAGSRPLPHGRIEGAQIEDGGEERRARREVVHRFRVERVCGHHQGRPGGHRDSVRAEPEVIAHDAEDEENGQPVQDEVQDVVAPGGVP